MQPINPTYSPTIYGKVDYPVRILEIVKEIIRKI